MRAAGLITIGAAKADIKTAHFPIGQDDNVGPSRALQPEITEHPNLSTPFSRLPYRGPRAILQVVPPDPQRVHQKALFVP